METGKKRERNTNFTQQETEILVSLIESKKLIIENKKSDAVTWQQKEKAWKTIEVEFNSHNAGSFRGAKHLKLKYESLKRDTRKKIGLICAEHCEGDEGVNKLPRLTPIEQRVKEIFLPSAQNWEESYSECDQLDQSYETKPYDNLAQANLDVAELQRQIIEEELQEIRLRNQILREELKHKRELHELETEHILLKIRILQRESDNKKK